MEEVIGEKVAVSVKTSLTVCDRGGMFLYTELRFEELGAGADVEMYSSSSSSSLSEKEKVEDEDEIVATFVLSPKIGGKWRKCEHHDGAEELAVLKDEAVVGVLGGVGGISVSHDGVFMSDCAWAAAALVRLVNSADGLVSGFFTGVLEGA